MCKHPYLRGQDLFGPPTASSSDYRQSSFSSFSVGDNLSEILAGDKGRCADWGLLALLRRATAYQIACDIRWNRRHIRSKVNPSDAGSRRATLGWYRPGEKRVGRVSPALFSGSNVPFVDRFMVEPRRRVRLSLVELLPVTYRVTLCLDDPVPRLAEVRRVEISLYDSLGFVEPTADLVLARPSRCTCGKARRWCSCQPLVCLSTPQHHPRSSRLSQGKCGPRKTPRRRNRRARRPRPFSKNGASELWAKRYILEIFAGCAHLSDVCRQVSLSVAAPIEIAKGDCFDILRPRTLRLVRYWISSGLVWFTHFATPCSEWSAARPHGNQSGTAQRLASVTASLIRLCMSSGAFWSLENPQSSALWAWPPLQGIIALPHTLVVTAHLCRFGAPYKKPTVIATNCAELVALEKRCKCSQLHVRLRGLVRIQVQGKWTWVWKTSLASAYPPALCHQFAAALRRCAPGNAFGSRPVLLSDYWESQLRGRPIEPFSALSFACCLRRWQAPWPAEADAKMEG